MSVDQPATPTEPAVRRDSSGRLLPGGGALYRGGRVPKWLKALKAELKAGSKEAVGWARDAIKSPDTDDKVKAALFKTFLEFTAPKPKQQLEVRRADDELLSGIDRGALAEWATRED